MKTKDRIYVRNWGTFPIWISSVRISDHTHLSKKENSMTIRWISLLLVLAFVITGCGSSQTNVAESPGLPLTAPTELPLADPTKLPLADPTKIPLTILIPAEPTKGDKPQMNPTLPTPSAPGLEGLIETAKQDLAQRLSIQTSDIVLVDAKEVTWPDGSLGCPQPGMMYIQVLIPGYLIKLKYDIREFEYHAGKDRSLTYCKNPTPPVEGMPSGT
jgi:hypothetical protein